MKILVTGGSGFIGSALIRYILTQTEHSVINVDKLTYAGSEISLSSITNLPGYQFEYADICDHDEIVRILEIYQPDTIINLAAESHVDRSIDDAGNFIQTNIVGVYSLLDASNKYYQQLSPSKQARFRFHQVSTDEVYGDLNQDDQEIFTETSRYQPSSPYSASKAGADHLVRAWHRTYGLPVVISSSSNNFGPYQFPEKLIPLTVLNAIEGKALPVYGDGSQIRDWLYVEDHVTALLKVSCEGKIGETYNISAGELHTNLSVVELICSILQKLRPIEQHYKLLIQFVDDRPGHDIQYASSADKAKRDLAWKPIMPFETGMLNTVNWYINNIGWCIKIQHQVYQRERLGLPN